MPPRGSTHSAVRTRSGSPRPTTGASCGTGRNPSAPAPRIEGRRDGTKRPDAAAAAHAARTGRARSPVRSSPASAQGRLSSGRRKPIGDRRAPGTACRRGRTTCRPASAHVVADRAAQRQHAADRRAEAPAEHARQPRALQRILQLRVLGQHVGRQAVLAPQVIVDVLIGRIDQRGIDLQPLRQRGAESRGVGRRWRRRCRPRVASSAGSRHTGSPSARQCACSAQRGSCSPG